MRLLLTAAALLLLPALAHASSFETAACPVKVAADEKIACGVLTVPEDRAKPEGRQVRLPVMIFHSRSTTPAPDPVIFLPGGPGGSSTRQTSGRNNPFLDTRDFILLEPRGAGFSQPALNCPQINAIKGEIAAGHHRDDADAVLSKAAGDCRTDLTAQGIDLNHYTSADTAQDIEDLRLALNIKSWNVFGHSYGTRLALTYLRDHPDGVRSVMLDSTLPPEASFDEYATANLERALGAVFDGCAANAACHAAWPDLKADFYGLVAAADTSPLQPPAGIMGSDGKPVVIDGAQIVDAIYADLHNPSAIGGIPGVVEGALHGQMQPLSELIKSNQGPSSFVWGLRLSVWCGEEMPFEDPARVEAQTDPARGLGGIDERTASTAMCKAWNVVPASARESLAVTSDKPVLLLAGEFDPDTPPAWAYAAAQRLPHATVVLMKGKSHGAGFNRCGAEIEAGFLADPAAQVAVACAAALPEPDFTPPAK